MPRFFWHHLFHHIISNQKSCRYNYLLVVEHLHGVVPSHAPVWCPASHEHNFGLSFGRQEHSGGTGQTATGRTTSHGRDDKGRRRATQRGGGSGKHGNGDGGGSSERCRHKLHLAVRDLETTERELKTPIGYNWILLDPVDSRLFVSLWDRCSTLFGDPEWRSKTSGRQQSRTTSRIL